MVIYSAFGQFRGAEWGMTVDEVRESTGDKAREGRYFDFENGNQSYGFKSQLGFGSWQEEVYSNYHFIHNKLRSGSYVFYQLSYAKVYGMLQDLSSEYGRYEVYYGDQKLKRTTKINSDKGFNHYLEKGNSLEFIWKGTRDTKVVLRVIATGTDAFGTWGWLSFYEKEYFVKSIEPYVIRSLGEDQ